MKELKAFYLACLLEKLDDQIKLTYDVVILHSYLKKCKDGEIWNNVLNICNIFFKCSSLLQMLLFQFQENVCKN